MDIFKTMEITASGLNAERARMNTIASNLANAKTTRTAEGGPYKRLDPVFQAVPMAEKFRDMVGEEAAHASALVKVQSIKQDDSPPQMVYDPSHPDADPNGYVTIVSKVVKDVTEEDLRKGAEAMAGVAG